MSSLENSKGKKSRQRGIRASRTKLERALHSAGFKTQAALAEKIADSEGLTSVPKDLVSKAFREMLIEPQSLERIASALEVEAYTLYLSQEDLEHKPEVKAELPNEPVENTLSRPLLFLALIVLGLIFGWLTLTESEEPPPLQLTSFKTSILIYPSDKALYPLADQVKQRLGAEYKTTLIPRALNRFQPPSVGLLNEFQSDWLLSLGAQRRGRYLGVQISLQSEEGIYPLLTLHASQDDGILSILPEDENTGSLSANTRTVVDTKKPTITSSLLSGAQLQNFLSARELIEDYQAFENLEKAQSLLEELLREHPEYGPGYGALCEITLYQSWRGNEKEMIAQAGSLCDKASELAPDDLYILSVIGFLYSKAGEQDKARAQYEKILARHSTNVEALMGLATVYFDLYRNGEGDDMLTQALGYGRQATLVQPDYWRPFQLLAIIEFSSGNIDGAIGAWESLIALQPNELVLANLGLMYICRAQFELAEERLASASALAPDSYMPLEGLASVSFYQGDFPRALELRKHVLSIVANDDGGIHQQWGDLADTYRHMGMIGEAKENYTKALTILERDALRGAESEDDNIYRIYYQSFLLSDSADLSALEIQLRGASSEALSTPALIRKAQTYLVLGHEGEAFNILHQATSKCPVYNHLPEFSSAADQ